MTDDTRLRTSHDMRAVVGSAMAATALVAMVELLNRFVLQWVELHPAMLSIGTVWTLAVTVTAVGQIHQTFRHWWIGATVATVGAMIFFGWEWLQRSDVLLPGIRRTGPMISVASYG